MEQLVNNGTTTTSQSIDNSTNPVSFTVTDASVFPATGNFRVRIEDEILLVTAVSGSTLTATRAQEGTSIASHSSGAGINFCLTKGSVQRVIGEFTLVTTSGSMPPTDFGRQAKLTDTPVDARYTGSAWQYFGPSFGPFVGAAASDYSTHINWSTYAYANQTGPTMLFGDTGGDSGDQGRQMVQSLSAGNTTMTIAFLMHRSPNMDSINAGITVRDSGSSKHVRHVYVDTTTPSHQLGIYRYTNDTTYAGTTDIGKAAIVSQFVKFMKVVVNTTGSTISVYLSPDFINWRLAKSYSYSGFFTPDQIGFFLIAFSGAGDGTGDTFMHVLHATCVNAP